MSTSMPVVPKQEKEVEDSKFLLELFDRPDELTLDKTTADFLIQRGIPQDTWETIGFRTSRDGQYLIYPCAYPPSINHNTNSMVNAVDYPIIYRARRLPHSREKHPNAARFYNSPESLRPGGVMPITYMPDYQKIAQAVSRNGGVLHVFEGDIDTMTAYAAGIWNAVGLFAAGNRLDADIPVQLANMKVTVVRFYPDNDNAGVQVTTKFLDLLHKFKIQASAYKVPFFLEGKVIKDNNDFWLACGCNENIYMHELNKMEKWVLATPEQIHYARTNDYFKPELYDLIIDKLGVSNFNNRGFSELTVCPFGNHAHDNTNPAFSWNKETRVGHCQKCAKSYMTKEVSEALGISWNDYVNDKRESTLLPSNNTSENQIVADKRAKVEAANGQVLGNKHMVHVANRRMQYAGASDDELWMDMTAAIDDYELRLTGQQLPKYPPIPNPLRSAIGHLDGNANAFARPCMAGVMGVSGGFKTTFLTYMISEWAKQGYNVMVWSPEWSPERHADRIVQTHGGLRMPEMTSLQRHYHEQHLIETGELTAEDKRIFGKGVSDAKMGYAVNALNKIRTQWTGQVIFLKAFSATVTDLLAQLREAHERLSERGNTPHVVIIDYLQMIKPPDEAYRWSEKDTLDMIKEEGLRNGWLSFVATQSTKSATRGVHDGSTFLDSTSAVNVRDDVLNLFLSVNPLPEIMSISVLDPVTGKHREKYYREVAIGVLKNSEGKTGTEDDAPRVLIDLERMTLISPEEFALLKAKKS